jgi:hypothetical protein
MARKLKTYQTSLGFYDLAIAAPSMKAALEAWGAGSNLFHQGVAKESGDPEIVAATMSKPGVVLRRPVGSFGPFREHADLPTDLAGDGPKPRQKKTLAKPKDQVPRTTDDTAARKAHLRSRGSSGAGRKRPPGSRQLPGCKQSWERVKGSAMRGVRVPEEPSIDSPEARS